LKSLVTDFHPADRLVDSRPLFITVQSDIEKRAVVMLMRGM
jgi:hypothetical protein